MEDVDYAKVRMAESVMVRPKEVAYTSEGPTVVLRRMRQAGLSHIFVLDRERRLVGLAEAEEVARLAERDERELGAAVDKDAPAVERRTPLREVLPSFWMIVTHQSPSLTKKGGWPAESSEVRS